MLVYNVHDPNSFDSLENWKNEFLHHKGLTNGSYFPFVVVGNKIDGQSNLQVCRNDLV